MRGRGGFVRFNIAREWFGEGVLGDLRGLKCGGAGVVPLPVVFPVKFLEGYSPSL